MRDDQLLPEGEIATNEEMFALLRDETAPLSARLNACDAASHQSQLVDKRRAAPALLVALKSSDEVLRTQAANALGALSSRLATFPLVKLAMDKTESDSVRIMAIHSLFSIGDTRAIPPLTQIMFDQTDDLQIRAEAIEWTSHFAETKSLNDYIALLSDSAPDIRFWAAFGLAQLDQVTDISLALDKLDEITASDHALPIYWGWHIDREAIQALEAIYYRKVLPSIKNTNKHSWINPSTCLISPAAEYMTFIQQYRRWKNDWRYDTSSPPPISFRVNPDWLTERLRENWPKVRLNVRQPKPKTYLLDWQLGTKRKPLIGGLHRDGYSVVLTGDDAVTHQFAAWYRSIIPPEQILYLYHWADEAIELSPTT